MIFQRYAEYYDIVYKNKGYKREILYLDRLFKKYRKSKIKTILDIGCGTANHMIPMIGSGYRMTGVDLSSQMLKVARDKLDRLGFKADLMKASAQTFAINKKFDAVICLFSVINYAAANGDIRKTLENICAHMKKGSLFVLDFWNADVVVNHYRPQKNNSFHKNGMDIERQSVTKIYPAQQKCEVNYVCVVKQSGRLIRRDEEKHVLKYFSVEEMRDYLTTAGFEVVDMHPFLNPGGKIRKNSWDVTAVVRKV